MSETDENALIGKLVKEHAEAKRRRELAALALTQHAGELKIVAERVEAGAFDNARTLLRKQLVEGLGLEKLHALLTEEGEWSAKAAELAAQLERLGIPVN